MKRILLFALLLFVASSLASAELSKRVPDSLVLCVGGYDDNEFEYGRQIVMKRDSVSWIDMDDDIHISTEPCLVKWDYYHPAPPGGDDTEWRITCSVGETVYYDAPARNLSTAPGTGHLRWIEHQTGRLYWATMDCHMKMTGP